MVDYLSEIPLPGAMLSPTAAHSAADFAEHRSLGFIAGPENRLVAGTLNRLMHLSSGRIGEGPSSCRIPKVIALAGSTGTGKTHLIQGLVRHWNTQRGAEKAAYFTAGDFYRQLLDAIKRSAVTDFRRALRGFELLAIDDLDELPNGAYISQELRFTLDASEESGQTVVVTSRRHATALSNISPDVRSRLSAGLMLQLAPPGSLARARILRRASESLDRPFSDEVATRLADGLPGTVRELYGAVFEFCASSANSASDKLADVEQFLTARSARRPALREIVATVARYYRLPQSRLKSNSRRQSIVSARAMVVYLARELAGCSYEQIGQALGGRDHTTIIHNYRKIDRQRADDPVIQEAIEELRRVLSNR